MVSVMLLLLSSYAAMTATEELERISLKGKSQYERETILSRKKMPKDTLTVDPKTEVDILKHSNVGISDNNVVIYSIDYDMTKKIIAHQFNFHIDVFYKLKSQGILPHKIYCFEDDTINYLVYASEQGINLSLSSQINKFNMQDLKEVYLKVFNLFEKLAENGIVLVNFGTTMVLLSPTGDLLLSPNDLAYFYPEDELCYISKNNIFWKDNKDPIDFPSVESVHGIQHNAMKPDKSHNWYFFTKLIEEYCNYRKTKDLNENEKESLNSFKNEIKKLNVGVYVSQKIDYTADDVKKIIETWDPSGLIKKTKPSSPQVKSHKSRSRVSSITEISVVDDFGKKSSPKITYKRRKSNVSSNVSLSSSSKKDKQKKKGSKGGGLFKSFRQCCSGKE